MNTVLIIILVIVVLIGTYQILFSKKSIKTSSETDMEEDVIDTNIDMLVKEIADIFTAQLRINLEDDNLSYQELQKRRKDLAKLTTALSKASTGDSRSRKELVNRIIGILTTKGYGYSFTEKDLNKIIPFDNIDRLNEWEIHEILIYLYTKQYGTSGFSQMIEDFNLCRKVPGADGRMYLKITKQMIREVLQDIANGKSKLGTVALSYNDKLQIISEMIYAKSYGFECIESLYRQEIDEIDCGITGIPVGSFNIAISNKTNREIRYSYQSVCIMWKGRNINLEYLGFASEEEFERVCKNVYRYNASEALSQKTGYIVSTMPDGSRIAVSRPPFSDSWAMYLRKFTAGEKAPEPAKLIKDDIENRWILLVLIKWCIKAEQNILITGQAGTGKSTWLKALIRYISTELNIRILELSFELAVRYLYPDLNISTMQETPTITTDKAIGFSKKANAAVMIMGELATALQSVQYVQTCQVNSRQGFGTHHAGTTEEMVESIAGNFTELGLYKDKNDAVAAVAKTINIDFHLSFLSGDRHPAYISEVLPYENIEFPSESKELENATYKEKAYADVPKYFKDSISPKKFEVNRLCHWTDEGGRKRFVLDNLPSKRFESDMIQCMTEKDQNEYRKDMEMLKKAWNEVESGEQISTEVNEWIERVYSE